MPLACANEYRLISGTLSPIDVICGCSSDDMFDLVALTRGVCDVTHFH